MFAKIKVFNARNKKFVIDVIVVGDNIVPTNDLDPNRSTVEDSAVDNNDKVYLTRDTSRFSSIYALGDIIDLSSNDNPGTIGTTRGNGLFSDV